MKLLIGATLAAIILSACGTRDNHVDPTGISNETATIRRCLGGEPASLDPAQATDTYSFGILRDVYEGLTTESARGKIIPGVAESWTVNKSATEYIFRLRPNARWSNGVRVTSRDFIAAWRRVVDPKSGSPVADTLRPIVGAAEIIAGRLPPTALGVSGLGDSQLIVRLAKPTPYFLQLLTHTGLFPIYSEASAATHSPRAWVSNGPYVLSRWIPGQEIRLTKNPSYWDNKGVRIRQVDYLFTPDENTELRDYLAGEVDITDSVPTNAIAWIKRKFPDQLHVWPFLGVAYYAINMRNPAFRGNPSLRQALSMAIDRRLLATHVLDFDQKPAYGFVPAGTWNYSPQSWNWDALNDAQRIAEARRLYRQAGYSEQHPLKIRLLINSNALIRDTALATAEMWKSGLGIRTTIIEQEYRVFLQTRRDPSKWDIARLGWTADYNDASDFLDIFRAGSPNDDSRYANPIFDKIMDQAAATGDPTARRHLLERAEDTMLADYPVIPIYFYVSKRLIKPYVGGARATIMDRMYSKYLFIRPH